MINSTIYLPGLSKANDYSMNTNYCIVSAWGIFIAIYYVLGKIWQRDLNMDFLQYPTNEQLERRHISVSKMLLFQCCSHFVLFQCMRQILRFKIYYITSRTINHCMRNLSCLIRNLFPKKFFHKNVFLFINCLT